MSREYDRLALSGQSTISLVLPSTQYIIIAIIVHMNESHICLFQDTSQGILVLTVTV